VNQFINTALAEKVAGLVHGMTVATRNVDDFAATAVPIISPWEIGAK
jgi:hypothetical protein